jgi:hypothetical protein
MARIELETQLGDGLELFSPLQYEIAKFCYGHGRDPPANGRISSPIKAAIIGLPPKGCQEIEGICYDPQIPQMAQIRPEVELPVFYKSDLSTVSDPQN